MSGLNRTFYQGIITPVPETKLIPAVSSSRDHVQGSENAAVTLTEFGDYQCPYCGQAYWIIKNLQQIFAGDDELSFVFRNFPLTQVHPDAQRAAEAAEASGAQGKFWEMHDILYENQDALGDASLYQYARTLDLDMERFENDLSNNSFAKRIREDFISGIRSGVNGTPCFFINGLRYDYSWDEASLSVTIKQLIASKHERKKDRRH